MIWTAFGEIGGIYLKIETSRRKQGRFFPSSGTQNQLLKIKLSLGIFIGSQGLCSGVGSDRAASLYITNYFTLCNLISILSYLQISYRILVHFQVPYRDSDKQNPFNVMSNCHVMQSELAQIIIKIHLCVVFSNCDLKKS